MGLRDVFHTDLVLLHAPSVYNFREETIMQGPLADAVPSTDEFEMYPVGITSIASYLGKNHYNVRIVNLAYRMLRDPSFNVAKRINDLKATVFGVDLHWLPHADGALAVAELTKRLHPESYVLLGGLSSSYYHQELIRLPFVDFVLRGDSTEEPCRQLLSSLRGKRTMDTVENLTWKRLNGEVVVNPLTFIPTDLDYVDVPDYLYAAKCVFKYHSFEDLVPYLRWLKHPTTMLLNSRGCTLDCATCGGSRSAYERICQRSWPAFRSPEKLVSDVRSIKSFSRSPIMLVHDPRLGGLERAERLFALLKEEGVPNEFVIEIFYPAGDDYFQMVQDSVPRWSAELTLETPDERLRKLGSLKFPVPNSRIEETVASALWHRCRRFDMFFMVGIPHQTYDDVMATIPYCEQLIDRFDADRRLQFFISPMGPFLDPGSGGFEDPKYGYTHYYDTVAEHREALHEPTWKRILSYETDAMTREEIFAASYDSAAALNALKFKHGLIDRRTFELVESHQRTARRAMEAIEAAADLPESERAAALAKVRRDVLEANADSLFSKEELEWQSLSGFRVSLPLVRALLLAFFEELAFGAYRLAGSYDTAVYRDQRAVPATFDWIEMEGELGRGVGAAPLGRGE